MSTSVIRQSARAFVSNPPAAPGNGATVVLFTTHDRATGGSGETVRPPQYERSDGQVVKIDPDSIETVTVTWHKHDQASAANGLRAYKRDSSGAWVETDMKDQWNAANIGAGAPIQIPALSAGQEWSETFEVGSARGFCIEQTAGATGPTADTGWDISISVTYAQQEG